MESILTSVKKILGIQEDYTSFDTDIIIHINTVFSILTQLGLGPPEGFVIQDKSSLWSDFIPENDPRLSMAKSLVGMRVKFLFDPSASSVVTDSMNKQIAELEWRIKVACETKYC